jgi:hypothetical protein
MENTENLFKCLKILPTDYENYGGEVKRWANPELDYPDCSRGCKFFVKLIEPHSSDWGVCAKPKSPRAGMLTWEHLAGFGCFEPEPEEV